MCRHVKSAQGPIKFVRVPMSDVEAARAVAPPRAATSDQSRKFAVMGAAILEKLCRSGNLDVRSKRESPYILNTVRGRTAVSVIVSAVDGELGNKHMIVPLSALRRPPGTVRHVFVCAFVSKREKLRESNGGINSRLAGWATELEVLRNAESSLRINTCLRVASVPVSALHPIQTLRHYLTPPTERKETCENSSPESPAQQPSAAATSRSSTSTTGSTGPSSDGPTAP